MSITGNITRSGITRNVTRGVTESFFYGINPQLHYNFLEDKSLSARVGPTLTCTRSGATAKYRDSSGVVQTASANIARFDHDASGASLGLLVEEARTNIALHSNDWTNAVYDTVTNITPLKDATGPDGVANSASTLTATANGGVISQAITVASAAYTTSVWVRRKTGTGTVEITDNGFTNATDVTSDINSSTYTQVGKITRTQANPVVGIRLGTSGDEVEVAYLQCEAGAFATSPIETGAASVARGGDDVNTSDVSWYNEVEGSFYAKGARISTATAGKQPQLFSISNGVITNKWEMGQFTDARAVSELRTAAQNFLTVTDIWTDTNNHQLAVAAKVNDMQMYADGTASSPDTSLAMPTSPNVFRVGGRYVATGGEWNGHIAEIRYYNTRFTNAQLEDMSNGVFP